MGQDDDMNNIFGNVCFSWKKNAKNKICFLSLFEDKQQFKFGVVMTCHLTLVLACFSVIFSRFFIKNRGLLEQLLMDSGLL